MATRNSNPEIEQQRPVIFNGPLNLTIPPLSAERHAQCKQKKALVHKPNGKVKFSPVKVEISDPISSSTKQPTPDSQQANGWQHMTIRKAEEKKSKEHALQAWTDMIVPSWRTAVATIPFKRQQEETFSVSDGVVVRCPDAVLDPIVARTRARWHWYAYGRQQNPALGTLSHLPLEIRNLIWRTLLLSEAALYYHRPDDWQDVIDQLLLCYDKWKRLYRKYPRLFFPGAVILRNTLPLAGWEFDAMFFSTSTFHFSSAHYYLRWMSERTARHV